MTDGVNGLLVPPGDPWALAAATARLLSDRPLAAALGRAARQTIEQRFSADRMAEATERLYVDLLAEKRARRVDTSWSIRTSSRHAR
jgi:glycosyltransferase involved in cell wall biosynthesis